VKNEPTHLLLKPMALDLKSGWLVRKHQDGE